MMDKLCFLVVDDDDSEIYLAKRVFKKKFPDIELKTVSNGRDALNLLNLRKVDAILLDINMPIMDGFDFLKAYMETNKSEITVPIMMMSSSNNKSDIEKACFFKCVFRYGEKPISEDQITICLDHLEHQPSM